MWHALPAHDLIIGWKPMPHYTTLLGVLRNSYAS